MQFSATSNFPEFSNAIAAWIRFRNVTVPQALRFQGRLLAKLLITLTPPKNRAQGRAAVKRDIERAIRPLRPIDWKSPEIRALIRGRNYAGLEAVFQRSTGDIANVRVLPFSPDLHQKERDRRGRVRRFKRKATPDAPQVTAYIRSKQENVGRGKGGWASAFIHLGGSPAAWIAEHKDTGDVVDQADNFVTPYIEMINKSEWASRGDDDRIVSYALRSRASAILADIAHAERKAAERAGLK